MEDFQPLSNLLKTALPAAGEVPVAEAVQQKLNRCWLQQTDAAAIHGHPLLFTSGRLVVFVASAAWGNEIRHRAARLRDGLVASGIRVTEVEVKILPDLQAAQKNTK